MTVHSRRSDTLSLQAQQKNVTVKSGVDIHISHQYAPAETTASSGGESPSSSDGDDDNNNKDHHHPLISSSPRRIRHSLRLLRHSSSSSSMLRRSLFTSPTKRRNMLLGCIGLMFLCSSSILMDLLFSSSSTYPTTSMTKDQHLNFFSNQMPFSPAHEVESIGKLEDT